MFSALKKYNITSKELSEFIIYNYNSDIDNINELNLQDKEEFNINEIEINNEYYLYIPKIKLFLVINNLKIKKFLYKNKCMIFTDNYSKNVSKINNQKLIYYNIEFKKKYLEYINRIYEINLNTLNKTLVLINNNLIQNKIYTNIYNYIIYEYNFKIYKHVNDYLDGKCEGAISFKMINKKYFIYFYKNIHCEYCYEDISIYSPKYIYSLKLLI